MGVRLQRCLGPATALTPAQYTLETASGRPAVCCPGCGGISELPETHRIHDSGRVDYVWACPTEPCAFMEFLELESHLE